LHDSRFRNLSIGARFVVTQELAGTSDEFFGGNSNATPARTCSNLQPGDGGIIDPSQVQRCNPQANDRRADYSDLYLTVRNPKIYTIPKLRVSLNPAFRFIFPTSAESRYQTLRLGITPSLSLSRSFWRDRIRVGYGLGFTKYFHQYTTPQINPSAQGAATTQGDNPYDGVVGAGLSNYYVDPSRVGTVGGRNTNYSLAHTINGGVVVSSKWSVDVLYIIIDAFAYDTGSCMVTTEGVTVNTCQAGDAVAARSGSSVTRPGHKDNQIFWATVNYQAYDWLGASLAWINSAPLQKPDSSYRQGIISTDYNAFTTVQLSATVAIDRLAGKIWKR
jgi:hypothetical protein